MLLNEHQSKRLFSQKGVPVPPGMLVQPGQKIEKPEFPAPWCCKAQVLAGGRGKAGGVVTASTEEELADVCSKLFDLTIKGHRAPLVRVEPAVQYITEFYMSFAVSRKAEAYVLTVGAGGVDVESQSSASMCIQPLSSLEGLRPRHVRTAFFNLSASAGLGREYWPSFQKLVFSLYEAVYDYGLLLAEINPLVALAGGEWLALDGKAEIDDMVRDSRVDLDEYYQPEHASEVENKARNAGLQFVDLDGWVGLMGNGAGLAMATMDQLNRSGLAAANFMDLGGAADAERMAVALDILFTNPKVKAVCVNLFGGIVSCATVARAIKQALQEYPDGAPPKPLVARMSGTGEYEARELLAALEQPDVHVARSMAQAMEMLRRIAKQLGVEPAEQTPALCIVASGKRLDFSPAEPDASCFPLLSLGPESNVLVQGITGKAARLHTERMQQYGVNIAAGVTPFKGGETVLGAPVYDSVRMAARNHRIDASIIFVPGPYAADAILEAAEARVPLVVCITEGVPQAHMLAVREKLAGLQTTLIGPNTPGLIIPGRFKLGIMPEQAYAPGPIAVFSRSGTLTYETAARLTAAGIGQSVCAGVGGDPFVGAGLATLIETVRNDADTKGVLILGEIGGDKEERLAEYVIRTRFDKPMFAFIAGRTAPEGKRLGHAGAILDEASGTADSKLQALADAGVVVCEDLASIPELVRDRIAGL